MLVPAELEAHEGNLQRRLLMTFHRRISIHNFTEAFKVKADHGGRLNELAAPPRVLFLSHGLVPYQLPRRTGVIGMSAASFSDHIVLLMELPPDLRHPLMAHPHLCLVKEQPN